MKRKPRSSSKSKNQMPQKNIEKPGKLDSDELLYPGLTVEKLRAFYRLNGLPISLGNHQKRTHRKTKSK